jgi:hypothetical protein
VRDAERQYEKLRRWRGEGAWTPLRKMLAPGAAAPPCLHLRTEPVRNIVTGRLEAWLCLACDAQLDPGARSAELSPDPSWPPIRRGR